MAKSKRKSLTAKPTESVEEKKTNEISKFSTKRICTAKWTEYPIVYSLDGEFLFQGLEDQVVVKSSKTGETVYILEYPKEEEMDEFSKNLEKGLFDQENEEKMQLVDEQKKQLEFYHQENIARTQRKEPIKITSIVQPPTNALCVLVAYSNGTVCLFDFKDEICLKKFIVGPPVLWMGVAEFNPDVVYLILDNTKTLTTWNGMEIYKKVDTRTRDKYAKCLNKLEKENPKVWNMIEFNLIHAHRDANLMQQSSLPFTDAAIRPIVTENLETGEKSHAGCFIAIVSGSKLRIWNSTNGQWHKHTHDRFLTSVDIHPVDDSFATGDVQGITLVWQGLDFPIVTRYHWHAQRAKALTFSANDGTFLLTGGEERVVVIWQLKTGMKTYIPRLSAPIKKISASPDGVHYAILFEDNSIVQVNPVELSTDWKVQGLALAGERPEHSVVSEGLVQDPRTKSVIMNGSNVHGAVQAFDCIRGREVFNLSLSYRNQIAPTRAGKKDIPLPVVRVQNAQFTPSGNWMATIENVDEKEEILKFWSFNVESNSFDLNSSIEHPHDSSKTNCLCAHPIREDIMVSGDNIGEWKLWIRVSRSVETSSNGTKHAHNPVNTKKKFVWTCRSVVAYRDFPIKSMNFSPDGSILAISYGSLITLWDPITNLLLHTLSYPLSKEVIEDMHFSKSTGENNLPLLIARSSSAVYVWNLLTFTLHWAYRVHNNAMCISTSNEEDRIVLSITPKRKSYEQTDSILIIFGMSSHIPLKIIRVPDLRIYKLTFINISTIAFIDEKSLLYRMSLEEGSNVIDSSERTAQKGGDLSMFAKMYSGSGQNKTKISQVASSSANVSQAAGNSLFDVPVHVIPPMTSLYESFMDEILQNCTGKDEESPVVDMKTEPVNKDAEPIRENPSKRKLHHEKSAIESETKKQETFSSFLGVFNKINAGNCEAIENKRKVKKQKVKK